MTKLVHGTPDNPVTEIDHKGEVFSQDENGEFDVPAHRVDEMKRHHGLVEKDGRKK